MHLKLVLKGNSFLCCWQAMSFTVILFRLNSALHTTQFAFPLNATHSSLIDSRLEFNKMQFDALCTYTFQAWNSLSTQCLHLRSRERHWTLRWTKQFLKQPQMKKATCRYVRLWESAKWHVQSCSRILIWQTCCQFRMFTREQENTPLIVETGEVQSFYVGLWSFRVFGVQANGRAGAVCHQKVNLVLTSCQTVSIWQRPHLFIFFFEGWHFPKQGNQPEMVSSIKQTQ